MEILLFIAGVAFLGALFLNVILSIVVTLLGIDGMKELCRRFKLDASDTACVFEKMLTYLHVGMYFFGVIISALSSSLNLTAPLFVLGVASAITSGVLHFALFAKKQHHDQDFHHILYNASRPLSLRTWVLCLIGLTVLDCWCAMTCISFGILVVSNFTLMYVKYQFQPHIGWQLLRATLKHGMIDANEPSLKSKRKRYATTK